MDFGRLFDTITIPAVCLVVLCGVASVTLLGIKRYRAPNRSVAKEYKNKMINYSCGYVLSLIFIFVLSYIVRTVSFAIYWP